VSNIHLTEFRGNAIPLQTLTAEISGKLSHFVFGDLLIGSPASAVQKLAGSGNKFFATAANPSAKSRGAAHHQGVLRDIMGNDGSGANHGPTPNGNAR
jgi:hypothetical protein